MVFLFSAYFSVSISLPQLTFSLQFGIKPSDSKLMRCSERPESDFSMLGEGDNSYEAAWMKTCKQNNKIINVKEGFPKLGRGIQRGVPTMKRNERGENKKVRWDWGVTWGFIQGGVQLALDGRKHLQDGGALESILGTNASFLFLDLQPCLQFQHLLFF